MLETKESIMGERMAVLETKVDDLKKDVSDVRSDIKEIKNMLNNSDDKYARKAELSDLKKDLYSKFMWVTGLLITVVLALKLTGVI